MSRRADLESLNKRELLDLARAADIRGRSSMSKAELVDALEADIAGDTGPHDEPESIEADDGGLGGFVLPGVSADDRAEARARRTALTIRLAKFVDEGRHCSWMSIEGHPCGLPVLVERDRCGLHGDGLLADRAIPLTGSLGF